LVEWGKNACPLISKESNVIDDKSKRPTVYDTFTFFNELELLEIRLNTLEKVVDKFVLVESSVTFTGKSKPLYFDEAKNEERFARFSDKIIHVKCELNFDDPQGDDEQSQKKRYQNGWSREHAQRNCILQGLRGVAQEKDVIMLSDVDEIMTPNTVVALKMCSSLPLEDGITFVQVQYHYTFFYQPDQNRSPWAGNARGGSKKVLKGTVAIYYDKFQQLTPPGVRWIAIRTEFGLSFNNAGFHFSPFPFGDAQRIVTKLDSWAHQESFRREESFRNINNWKNTLNSCHHCVVVNRLSDYNRLPLYVRQNRQKYERFLIPLSELIDDINPQKNQSQKDEL